ncbi:hypothetical protein ISCGN_002986 [Ixodes scapularis]
MSDPTMRRMPSLRARHERVRHRLCVTACADKLRQVTSRAEDLVLEHLMNISEDIIPPIATTPSTELKTTGEQSQPDSPAMMSANSEQKLTPQTDPITATKGGWSEGHLFPDENVPLRSAVHQSSDPPLQRVRPAAPGASEVKNDEGDGAKTRSQIPLTARPLNLTT